MAESEYRGELRVYGRCIGAALWVICGLAALPASAAPRISTPSTRVEIADVTAGEAAETEFPLVNNGTDPLKINEVVLSCGCMSPSYPSALQPGEKGLLKVKITTNPLWDGPVEKHVTVMSNDPEHPALALQIVAHMRPLFRFMPQNPAVVNFKKGDVVRQVFMITSTVSPPVAITGVASADPGTEARLLPAEPADKPGLTRVEMTARPAETAGDFTSTVTLQTAHPRVPTVPLVLRGVSQDGITVSPRLVYLNGLRGAAPTPPYFFVLFKRRGIFHVTNVQSDAPELQANVAPPDPEDANSGSTFIQINLQYKGGWSRGKHTGKITVTTDDPLFPKLELPYEATVER
jgi:uncharacterized protein DUF1573